jgi:TonB-dependent SusC/RagA subfamily outer membrane receptor
MKKILNLLLFSILTVTASAQKLNSEKELEVLRLLNKYFSTVTISNSNLRSFHIFHDTLIIFHSSFKEGSTVTNNDTTLIALDQIGKLTLINSKGNNEIAGVGLEFIPIKNSQFKKGEPVSPNSTISDQQLASTNGTLVQKMAGQSSGVVVGNDNSPGGTPKVRIRGITSINSNSNPLYIVDDVPITNINSINPDDIASVEVLKDPSSTAMYGVRGANGVVIIKTKRGGEEEVIPNELLKQKELSYVLWTFGEKASEIKKTKEGKKLIELIKSIKE